jgi:hypothetical protein
MKSRIFSAALCALVLSSGGREFRKIMPRSGVFINLA